MDSVVFKTLCCARSKTIFVNDKNSDVSESGDECNIQMYGCVIDFDESTALAVAEEESFRQLHLKDKKGL